MLRACVFAVLILGSCNLVDEASKKTGSDPDNGTKANACPVEASPAEVKAGEGVTIAAKGEDTWATIDQILIDDQVLSASKPSVVINPSYTRTYSVVAQRKDGNAQACTLKIIVTDGTIEELGCSLSASPATIENGVATDVTATLQVIGSAEISATSIDGIDLGSVVGGSKVVSLSAAKVISGRVETAVGDIASCAVSISAKALGVADGECKKVEPDEDDVAKFSAAQTLLDAENEAAKAAVIDAAHPGDGFVLLEGSSYAANGVSEGSANYGDDLTCDDIVQQIPGVSAPAADCELSESFRPDSHLTYYKLTNDGKHYDIYYPQNYSFKFYFYKNGSGEVTPVILKEILESGTTIDVELCECDPNANGIGDSDMDESMAAPSIYFIERNAARPTTYEGEAVHTNKSKRAYFKKTYIEPAPGFAKPACPMEHHVDT